MKRVGDRPMDRPEQVVKKFYDSVSFDQTPDGYQLLLDQRGAKTPAKKPLIVPTKELIAAVISEWQGQGETLDFATMPMSQRQMVFLDQATSEAARWRSVVVGYIQSDLLCYRAEQPPELVTRQEQQWGPVLAWAQKRLGAEFATTNGIISVPQDPALLAGLEKVLEQKSIAEIFILCSLTQITGSAVLALGVVEGEIAPEQGFTLSRLDETYQAEKWGEDSEAVEREAFLKASFDQDLHWLGLSR